jgi:MFS transporter, DHA1 family, multidrug resistance protein
MKTGFARYAIVLGLLAGTGPFAIDTYLPALPTIAADFGTSMAAAQASLIAFFAAVGFCQVIYGPVSDILGRRGPLYFGLVLFIVGSIGCSLATSIEMLIAFRVVQGIGACAGMVLSRAVVRDLYTGADAARLMSLIMLVFSVSPILAPLAGSALIALSGWRSIFVAISLTGVIGIGLVAFALPETRPREKRIAAGLGSAIRGYSHLLGDRHYLGVALVGGFSILTFYIFLGSSSFVYIGHFGLTPAEYSIAFAANAAGFIGVAQLSSPLARRFGFGQVIRAATIVMATVTAALFVLTFIGIDRVGTMVAMLSLAFGCVGLIYPMTNVLALEAHGPIAGMAAALMGSFHMLLGAVVITLFGLFTDGSSLPMVGAIAVCALGALITSRFAIRTRDGFKQTSG